MAGTASRNFAAVGLLGVVVRLVWHGWVSAAATALAIVVLAAPAGARTRPRAAPPAAPPPPGLSVQGARLMQDGAPWVARGLQIVGLVAPDADLAGKYVAAHAHFGAAELAQAVADHANVVRFQVSEFGLDPSSALYDPGYAAEVAQGVELARAAGLDVIVSLQSQGPAGIAPRCPLPDAGAAADWNELAAMFAADHGVMFELYNEPAVPATRAGWALWRDGGTVATGYGTCIAVGMQALIDEIRGAGASNVIIVPGLAGEVTLAGMGGLADPADPADPQLAYGVHYPNLTQQSTAWDRQFGNAAARVPVIVTEWQANSTTNCVADAPHAAPRLLAYLALKQIGIVGFALDLPGTIVADYSYAPTTYAGFACGTPGGGPGQLLFDTYAGEAAQRAGTAGPGGAESWMLSAGALGQIAILDPAATVRALDTPRTFVTGGSTPELAALGLTAAVPAEGFTDGSALARAVSTGALRAGTLAVVLELGPGSPLSQQRQPRTTFQIAAQAAHRNGMLFVAAPRLYLVDTLAPRTRPQNRDVAFLRRDLAGAAARYADAVVLPFGVAQSHLAGYADITQVAAWQATRARPGVAVIDGLSISGTHPPSGPRLAGAVRATSAGVAGYALSSAPPSTGGSSLSLLYSLYGRAG